ncbi:MAG: Asp/Glu/hydantoin racemase [Chloroflexi bacterium]|nr:Asp/Glu/hydantoin racemase [Chloroflexota bacterium]
MRGVPPNVTLIHTVAGLAPVFNGLAREVLPSGTRVVHVVDEDLLQDTIRRGSIADETRSRLASYVDFAAQSGADAVMVTCSSVGPVVDALTDSSSSNNRVPLMRVDLAMADEAVQRGARIGVLGTLKTTLEPTAALIRARALAAGRTVTVEARVADGAFEALQGGDTEEHDRRVMAVMQELLGRVDVLVLAQASMARVADQLPQDGRRVPILTSPRLGVERLRSLLEQQI